MGKLEDEMEELERHPYVMHLLQALTSSSTDDDDEKDEGEDANTSCKAYGEIICYGVGNFLPPSVAVNGSYALPRYPSAPMLQLALALVIRQQLANREDGHRRLQRRGARDRQRAAAW